MELRKISNLIVVFLLAAFAVLSVYGAFLGTERAQTFFSAPPLAIFWFLLLIFLAAGFIIYPSLRRRYPLALIHLGCILVLAGGLYGSQQGHILMSRLFGGSPLKEGMMQLHPGHSSKLVSTQTGDIIELAFTVLLDNAFIDYYDKPVIRLYRDRIGLVDIAPEIGESVPLPEDLGTVQIVRAFKNFKVKPQEGLLVPYDAEDEPGANRAWELRVTENDGKTTTVYVFERFPMHRVESRTYIAEYLRPQMVKDYKSILQVIENGRQVKASMIEVNKPLYYGGYHFYQNTFGHDESGPVSGIKVVSVRGTWTVFVGYGLIFAGLVVQCWKKLYRLASQQNRRHPDTQSGASEGLQ